MCTTLKRIKEYIDSKGLSVRGFEEAVGFSNGSFASQLKNNRTIGVDRVENILRKYPDINAEWLLTGKGAMLKDGIQLATPHVEKNFKLQTDRVVGLQSVPLYELDATAGLVSLFNDSIRQVPINHLQIPDLPPCSGAVYVRGDSMYPLLKSGDIVCYKEVSTDYKSILWGEMYLLSFILEGESYITIKYLQKSEQEGMVCLVSHNQYHSPKDIPAKSITALALVKASVRFNTMG